MGAILLINVVDWQSNMVCRIYAVLMNLVDREVRGNNVDTVVIMLTEWWRGNIIC